MANALSVDRFVEVKMGEMINPGKFWISYRNHPKAKLVYDRLEADLTKLLSSGGGSARASYDPDEIVAVKRTIDSV